MINLVNQQLHRRRRHPIRQFCNIHEHDKSVYLMANINHSIYQMTFMYTDFLCKEEKKLYKNIYK